MTRPVVALFVGRGALALSLLTPGVGCEASDQSCSGATMFQVYEPGLDTSALPLCTSDTTATPGTYLAPAAFAGSALLSDAGAALCSTVCAQAPQATPCCVSVWEPNTVLCDPACAP